MGITVAEVRRRWGRAKDGLTEAAAQVITQHGEAIADLNRQQLYESGIDGYGDNLATYKRDKYARKKYGMNPKPGYGNPDLYLTGDFQEGITVQVSGGSFTIGSYDQKSKFLLEKYGAQVLRLTISSKNTVRKDMLQPGLVKYLRRETGAR